MRLPRSIAGVLVALPLALAARTSAAQTLDAGIEPDASVPVDPRYATLPELTFRAMNTREEIRLRIYRPDGTVDPASVAALGRLFRDLPTGETSPVVPRTLQLLVRIVLHFGASRVDVVSAYRTGLASSGVRVRREGYHGVGSAIDFVLAGQDMAHVAAYARTLGHVGVGWYPREGFVHLDSREQSFFWENRSRRHHHGWDRPLDRGHEDRDAAWTAADDTPWEAPGTSVALVLHPPTRAGAHPPRSHRHAHHRAGHPRPAVHVFRGDR